MLTVKTGDTYPTVWRVPMDLTGADVRLIARRGKSTPIILASSVTNPVGGEVTHVLDGALPVGTYAVELEISVGGQVITAPTDSYENFRVIADLD